MIINFKVRIMKAGYGTPPNSPAKKGTGAHSKKPTGKKSAIGSGQHMSGGKKFATTNGKGGGKSHSYPTNK